MSNSRPSPIQPTFPKWIHPVIQQVLNLHSSGLIAWRELGFEEYKKYAIVPVYLDEGGRRYYEKGGRKGVQGKTDYIVDKTRFADPDLVQGGLNYLFYNRPFYGKDKEFTEQVFELHNQSASYLDQVGNLLARGRYVLEGGK